MALEEKKLIQKGWSQAKIRRWKEDKLKAAGNFERQQESQAGHSLSHWISFIGRMLKEGCSPIGLLLHFYNGDLTDEKFIIKRIMKVRFDRVDEDFLKMIEEDVLYLFVEKK